MSNFQVPRRFAGSCHALCNVGLVASIASLVAAFYQPFGSGYVLALCALSLALCGFAVAMLVSLAPASEFQAAASAIVDDATSDQDVRKLLESSFIPDGQLDGIPVGYMRPFREILAQQSNDGDGFASRVVRSLIARGINFDASRVFACHERATWTTQTLLHFAIEHGSPDFVGLLLAHGANPKSVRIVRDLRPLEEGARTAAIEENAFQMAERLCEAARREGMNDLARRENIQGALMASQARLQVLQVLETSARASRVLRRVYAV